MSLSPASMRKRKNEESALLCYLSYISTSEEQPLCSAALLAPGKVIFLQDAQRAQGF